MPGPGTRVGLDQIYAKILTVDYQNFEKNIIADVGLVPGVHSATKIYSPLFSTPKALLHRRSDLF